MLATSWLCFPKESDFTWENVWMMMRWGWQLSNSAQDVGIW